MRVYMHESVPALAILVALSACSEAPRAEAPQSEAEAPPADSAKSTSPEEQLAQWRGRIDSADREIIALLNRRAGYVQQLAPLKRQIGMEVRDPGREQQVLDGLRAANKGPLADESIEKIYQAIMAAMRDLQSQ